MGEVNHLGVREPHKHKTWRSQSMVSQHPMVEDTSTSSPMMVERSVCNARALPTPLVPCYRAEEPRARKNQTLEGRRIVAHRPSQLLQYELSGSCSRGCLAPAVGFVQLLQSEFSVHRFFHLDQALDNGLQ